MKYGRLAQPRLLLWLLLSAGFCRLLSLGLYPLSDKTESRYGEIARIMAETGNWVTPHIDYGVPFWGKPPLATWLSAMAIKLFGANEFAVRFPSFALAIGTVSLVFFLARNQKRKDLALVASVILCVSPMFFVAGGAVMTDPALVFGTTLSMVGFYAAVVSGDAFRKLWGYLFFVGLAIGLLSKGPVAVVLTGVPIFFWSAWQRKWRQVWQRLPWMSGTALTLVLTLPWYLLAESRTPGFLDYFIVGEHWKRFVEPGWEGDLYGGAHSMPRGTVWVLWLLTAFPWSFFVLVSFFFRSGRRRISEQMQEDKDWSRYLLLWTIAPILLFTLSGNILWTYVLPGIPAFSLLFATIWQSKEREQIWFVLRTSNTMFLILFIGVLSLSLDLIPFRTSQKILVDSYNETASDGSSLTYVFSRPYSAQFYSNGKALLLKSVDGDEAIFRNNQVDFLAIRSRDIMRLPEIVATRLEKQGEYMDGFSLYAEIPAGK
ncbi:MAG: glycosyltransferase family 39 protein [Deferrisomatales bacterium]|nr:glycosyltransferase family 39 protein [Deferrisomatales bacterium]